ncbi:MAG: ATP synthase F0 subunit C [Planctomycetes bacterium]|nr:ATP synthase F0 subunit C [Planctomycetota bacterium]
MGDVSPFLHAFAASAPLLSAGFALGCGAVGCGVGAGYIASHAARGTSRQPAVAGPLLRTMLIGQAISETPGIFALVIGLLLIFRAPDPYLAQSFAFMGAGLAVGLSALGSGLGASIAGGRACEAIARQPKAENRVALTMLLGQSIATSPSIFGFVIALLLGLIQYESNSVVRSMALLGAGISMGMGAIGPGLGIGIAGGEASTSVGMNSRASGTINRVLLIGAAVSESTSIYSFVVALLMMLFTRT